MKNTTAWQIPYPESGDHTRTWEYWQAIAERVDACLTTVTRRICCVAIQTAVQSIPFSSSSFTMLTFNDEAVDTDNMHSPSTNPSRITIPVSGIYLLTGYISFVSNSTGRRGAGWHINGTINAYGGQYFTMASTPSTSTVTAPALPVRLTAGQYVELGAFNETSPGVALNTAVVSGVQSYASVLKIGD